MDALEAKHSPRPLSALGLLAVGWGMGAIVALLVQALSRLAPLALEPLQHGQLSAFQGLLYVAWVAFTAYTEGYRGFQKRFAPGCALRAVELAEAPTLWRSVLAPAYCMSLFAAPRRRLISSWLLLIGITTLVIVVKRLPQPWRGIIDGGVVVGLSWGLVAVVYYALIAFRQPSRGR